MSIFNKKKSDSVGIKLPSYIEQSDRGYRVKGRISYHHTLRAAIKQKTGERDAK